MTNEDSLPIKIGLTLPQRGILFDATSVDEMLALAQWADEDPRFSSVWVGDSVLAKPRPDSLTLLGALTHATSRVRLGVGCMASFPVRDPLVFSYQWATLDILSAGRMDLAVCTGIVGGGLSADEGSQWGIANRDRAGLLEANIELTRSFWAGESVNHVSSRHTYQEAALAVTPVQDPCPIWIASNPPIDRAQRPLRRVARMADGWMSAALAPGRFGEFWNQLAELLDEESRDPDLFPTIAYHNININEDQDAAFEESKRFLDAYYGPVFSDEAIRSWTCLGSPQQCAEQIADLFHQGAKTITLRLVSWDQKGQYERLAEEVLPRL